MVSKIHQTTRNSDAIVKTTGLFPYRRGEPIIKALLFQCIVVLSAVFGAFEGIHLLETLLQYDEAKHVARQHRALSSVDEQARP